MSQQDHAALRDPQLLARAMFEDVSEGVVVYDRDLKYVLWNPFMESLTGLPASEVIGTSALELFPHLKRNGVDRLLARALQGERVATPDMPFTVPSTGRGGWVVARYAPFLAADGTVAGVIGLVTDVTDRKRAERALRESEERYREFFDRNLAAVFWNTLDGRILDCNEAAARLYGFDTKEELLTRGAGDLYVDAAERERLVGLLRERGSLVNIELRLKRKDGTPFWGLANWALVPASDEAPPLLEAIAVDITERKELEERLAHTHKLEAVGKLAGGIAHDFNNLLTTILGYSDLLLRRLQDGDASRDDVREIQRAGERAAALTRQLLAFSRKQLIEPRVLDLNGVIGDASKMLRRLVGEDVRIGLRLEPRLGRIRADAGQLEQILMNLVANSRDAMPDGGAIEIATKNTALREEDRRAYPYVQPGPYVEVLVSDTGSGIDSEVRKHIFEPFYTTKVKGKGTGLGLAMVYGIVKQSGGYVWALDRKGGGTTFRICLPIVDEPILDRPLSSSDRIRALRGTQTILVVEDEETVRNLSKGILEGSGYTVLTAKDGPSALALSSDFEKEIHLLVTDVVMPGMSGRELVNRLLPSRPFVRVLYVSGYTDETIAHHGILEPGTNFLQKPFTPSVLAKRVREVLEAG
jgi:PAS domain S-box-containing protein